MKEQIKYTPANETQRRIDKLKESDGVNEDSMHDLAVKEGKFREVLERKRLDAGTANELADIYSDEVLEKFEANKERWTDGLTDLRNRKAFDEELPQFLSLEKRKEKRKENRRKNNFSFLMVDFDFFKRVNDEYGHDAGDQALIKLTKIIKDQSRKADVVYRYGGEEFVVFLPNTSSAEAAVIAERIRAEVEKNYIEIVDSKGKNQQLNKTVSIGCVGTDQLEEWGRFTDKKAKEFLKIIVNNADMAMYNAKRPDANHPGRNRVIVYDKNLEARP